jgi:hypothetical protein
VDVAYSIYLLASEPAGVLDWIVRWVPHGQKAIVVSALLGIVIGGALFVGAFMTHQVTRQGLLVLLLAIVLYMVSGVGYAVWGLVAHGEVDAEIYMANQRYGNEINNAIWAYFVGIGCTSIVVGAAFLFAIRHAWRRFSRVGNAPEPASPVWAPTPSSNSAPPPVVGDLERLGALRDRGLLTDTEYQQAKAKLLSLS